MVVLCWYGTLWAIPSKFCPGARSKTTKCSSILAKDNDLNQLDREVKTNRLKYAVYYTRLKTVIFSKKFSDHHFLRALVNLVAF